MAPKIKPEDIDDEYAPGVCYLHSGIKTWLQVGASLLTVLNGLVGYQVFYQVPNLKLEVSQRMDRLENRMSIAEKNISDLIAIRNADHPRAIPFR